MHQRADKVDVLRGTIESLQDLRRSYNRRFESDPIKASDREYRWVLSRLRPRRAATLLDVACGGGHFLRQAISAGLVSYGCDISDKALELARAVAPSAQILLCNGEELPFGSGQFDYVTNLGSLEHFLSPERGVAEMVRVTKPEGGTVAVLLPNSHRLYEILHVWRRGYASPQNQELERFATVHEWRDFLRANGLHVQRIFADNTFSTSWKWRIVRTLAPFNLAHQFLFICTPSASGAAGCAPP